MRRFTPVAGIFMSLAVAGTTLAAPTTRAVAVDDYVFSPGTKTVVQGDYVKWTNVGVTSHTTTSRSALVWSATLNRGAAYTYTNAARGFFSAGLFAYVCTIHPGMAGRISVPMRVAPSTAARGTRFTIRWATMTAPSGYRYQVQKRNAGSTTWTLWKQTTAPYASFATTTSTPRGTYYFRGRLLRWNGTSWIPAGWSVAKGVSVT